MTDEMPDDPIDALSELFIDTDLEPTAEFADRLDADLRIAHAQRRRDRRASPVRGRVAVLGSVAVLILAVATAGLVWRDRSVSSALEMTAAQGVVVTLPDGSTVSDPADGFELPEGSVIVVRIGGSVAIDDVSLGEGAVVTVRDGLLVTVVPVDRPAARDVDQPRPPESDQPVDDPPPGSIAPTDRPGVDAPRTPNDSTPPAPSRSDPPSPSRPDPPSPSRPDSSVVEDPAVPVDEPSVVPSDASVDVGLRVRVDDGSNHVRVAWSTGPAADAGWRALVIRAYGDDAPDWPLGSQAVVIGESRGPGIHKLIDELARGTVFANYRIVVVDEFDGVVARSAVQTARLR